MEKFLDCLLVGDYYQAYHNSIKGMEEHGVASISFSRKGKGVL
jgi:hypothetical protein